MDDRELLAALGAWEIAGECELRCTRRGKSRLTRFVDTPAGSYVACVYAAGVTPQRVRYEHALLRELSAAGPPFAVPTPVPTGSGDTVVVAGEAGATGADGGRPVALFTVVPGEELDPQRVEHTRAFGAAAGQLHRAVAHIDPGPAPAWDGIYGAAERVLAGDRQLVESLAGAPVDGEGVRRIVRILERLMAEGPSVVARLPHQIRHGDCHRGNALVLGDRVTGFLDFEVAGPGARAMDLAHGAYYLWAWCDPPEAAWQHIAAFAGGYRSVVEPTAEEVAAVPLLARLYFAASVPHVVSRWRAGAASEERVRGRLEQVLRLDDFLERQRDRLVAVLAARRCDGRRASDCVA